MCADHPSRSTAAANVAEESKSNDLPTRQSESSFVSSSSVPKCDPRRWSEDLQLQVDASCSEDDVDSLPRVAINRAASTEQTRRPQERQMADEFVQKNDFCLSDFDAAKGLKVDAVVEHISQQIVTWATMCDAATVTYDHMIKKYPCLYHRALA